MSGVTIKRHRALQTMILLLFTIFVARLVFSQDIFLLVSPLIAVIVKFSTGIFAILSLISLLSSVSMRRESVHSMDHVRSRGQEDGHDHSHMSPESTWGRTTLALFVASLTLAFTWHPKAFGTNMIAQANTSSQNSARATASPASNSSGTTNWVQNTPGLSTSSFLADEAKFYASEGAVVQKPGEVSAAQIGIDWGSSSSKFLGRAVTLEGFVYRPKGLPSNEFIVTRFFIICCIADASPFGIAVESPAAGNLKNDQWVSVTGVIQNRDLPVLLNNYDPTDWYPDTRLQPVIVAKTIQPIPAPKLPYMVPSY